MAGGGGAWKVAYADFVTAMMALFMVLWISAQDTKVLISTSRYFQNPFRSTVEDKSGVMPYNREIKSNPRTAEDEGGFADPASKDKVVKLVLLNSVAAEISRLIALDQASDQAPMDVQVTSDGLRLTIFNRALKPVFKGKTAELTDWGSFLMQSLAWVIDRHHFLVAIDGHTQSGLDLTPDYSAWELSADRANTARRALVHYAVDASQIERVGGLADTQPLPGRAPDADVNQRVTVSLRIAIQGGNRTPGGSAESREAEPASTTGPAEVTTSPRTERPPAGVSTK